MVENNEDWAIFVVEAEGEKRIYRIRLVRPAGLVTSEYSNCVIVEWTFGDALPDKPLQEVHKAFEAHMEPLGLTTPTASSCMCTRNPE